MALPARGHSCGFGAEISRDTFVNIMPQYRPEGKAIGHPQLGRPITWREYREAVAIAREEGLWRFDKE